VLKIKSPRRGNFNNFKELISDKPMVVNIYAISLTGNVLVLNLRIWKIANKPKAIPISK
jgi:hypothetical protein